MPVFEWFSISSALIFYILFFISAFFKKKYRLSLLFVIMGILFQLSAAVYRTIISHHAPFSNAYESLLFFGLLYIIKIFLLSKLEMNIKRWMILPALAMLASALLLPDPMKTPSDLVPALRSFWIGIHVPAFFIGYSSIVMLLLGVLIELIGKKDLSFLIQNETKQSFFFITLGIVTGAFWGDISWGMFWNYDPKETWALITWLLLVLVIHVKNKPVRNTLVILTFLAMMFTYFGVMFLLPGLHSYR